MAGRKAGAVRDAFLNAIDRDECRGRRRPATDRFLLQLRLDRGDLVAGVALVDVDEWAQSDAGQLSDPDRADPANFAVRRQSGFWMRYGHVELSLSNKGKHARG